MSNEEDDIKGLADDLWEEKHEELVKAARALRQYAEENPDDLIVGYEHAFQGLLSARQELLYIANLVDEHSSGYVESVEEEFYSENSTLSVEQDLRSVEQR